jgi:hypothetical protein
MARTMRAVRRTHRDVRSANTPPAKIGAFFWLLFFAPAKKSNSLPQGVKALPFYFNDQKKRRWIPAFAGMTSWSEDKSWIPGFRRNDEREWKGFREVPTNSAYATSPHCVHPQTHD